MPVSLQKHSASAPPLSDADTSDYYLKALRGNGYGFVANNANTHVNFAEQRSSFSLNTDSSFVVFPELEYISKMTNFEYDMRIQGARHVTERQGIYDTHDSRSACSKCRPAWWRKPTFLSTNNMKDTVKFQSGSASYFLQDEYVRVKDVNYIPVADALIQPGEGILVYLQESAVIRETDSAIVAVNNRHLIHSAKINIESSANYYGSGRYDYIDEDRENSADKSTEIRVDTMATKAQGIYP